MTKHNIASLVLAAAITASPAAAAMFPPSPGDMAATIPLSFQAGDAVMSAGEYLVRVGAQGQIEICESGVYCAVVSMAGATTQTESQDLVFDNSGSELRLVGVAESNAVGSKTAVPTRELCIHNDDSPLGVSWH